MKLSLLELTQDVLNAIEGAEANTISESVESVQVAADIRYVYYDIIGRKDWQFLRKLKSFESVGDINKPTHLLIPDKTSKMEFLLYNKQKQGSARTFFKPINYRYPDEFLISVNGRDNTLPNYDVITDYDGVRFTIRNDAHPTFFTSFDDKRIVLDAYDSRIESTIQGTNTQASLFIHPVWEIDDDFVPELPAEMFAYFLAECMTYALAKKDDQIIQKTEQTARRHQNHLSQTHGVVQGGVRYQNYGRISPKAAANRRLSDSQGFGTAPPINWMP